MSYSSCESLARPYGCRAERLIGLLAAAALVTIVVALVAWAPREVTLGSFTTSLRERSSSQRHNARLAARALDGTVIAPREQLSFNALVGPWTADKGFEKAPVSYDGEMVLAWGGGVCQTSTTLYNAALLAGMEIVERHPHQWPARYAAPGRDAAVAFDSIDLILGNSLGQPVTIRVDCEGEHLTIWLVGREHPKVITGIERQVHDVIPPSTVVRSDSRYGRGIRRTETVGRPGYTVTTQRVFTQNGREVRRELISHDRYRPINKLITVGTG